MVKWILPKAFLHFFVLSPITAGRVGAGPGVISDELSPPPVFENYSPRMQHRQVGQVQQQQQQQRGSNNRSSSGDRSDRNERSDRNDRQGQGNERDAILSFIESVAVCWDNVLYLFVLKIKFFNHSK